MKNLCLILSLAFSASAMAQQDPLYSQYINNPLLINPAYTGSTTDLNASVMYRKQWAGFEGSPVTMNANAHMALSNNRMGTGLILLQDQVGADKTTEVTFTYGYHLPLSTDLKLSFGLQGGLVNYQTDYSEVTFNPADGKFVNQSEWKPNLGTGLILRSEKFMVGLSVPKLLKASNLVEQYSTTLYNQHAYALAAYVFQLSYRIKVKPWVMARMVSGAPVSFDYAASLKVDDSYSLGFFTRNLNTFGTFAQINLGDNLRFAYAFELPSGKSVGTHFTTHEVTLGVRFGVLNFHDLTAVRNF
ncbi:MAG: type IX secretion system membrane protein PorP/SprF [Cyclobacteriaceae bacterium]|nr:type IX secretion system membrane protein PorP/SprF [Cyclobacteriaceae bacterium]